MSDQPRASSSYHLDRAVIERIALRYPSRVRQGYVRGKLRSDPVYGAAFERIKDSPWPVLDIGCGVGLFESFVRESGGAMPLIGFDFDEPKIAQAREATKHYPGVEFHAADAARYAGHRGNVVILDVLHYLDAPAQARLLEEVARMIPPGGCCVIRDTLRSNTWRFRMTQLTEWFSGLVRWNKVSPVHFPSAEEISAPFLAAGFTSESGALWGETPFNSHVFTFRRPA